MDDSRVRRWLGALEARHLASLTPSEAARALRALSSCYVERRARLAAGGALDSAGKRAAFALFYAPLHFLVTREVVRAVDAAPGIVALTDLGCGTGAAGAPRGPGRAGDGGGGGRRMGARVRRMRCGRGRSQCMGDR